MPSPPSKRPLVWKKFYSNPKNARRHRQNVARRKQELKAWFASYKASLSCTRCRESAPETLTFHHLNPSEKRKGVTEMVVAGASIESILEEVSKCVVLCENCHRKHHYSVKRASVTRRTPVRTADPRIRDDAPTSYSVKWYRKPGNAAKKCAATRANRDKKRAWFSELKSGLSCSWCPENHPATLDFHHLGESSKHLEVSQMVLRNYSIKRITEEISKCIPLCANCHQKHTRSKSKSGDIHDAVD